MLHFHSPDVVIADKLSAVGQAFSYKRDEIGHGGSFPPKKSREIYQLIKEGCVEGISLVEWGALFRDENFWDHHIDPSELDDVILTIFSEVESNAELRSLVILNAVMTIEDSSNWLPEDIMCRFHLLMHSLRGKDLLCFKLINLLNNGDYQGLADALVVADATPNELLDILSWPKFVAMKENLETAIIDRFTRDMAIKNEAMVRRLLEQLERQALIELIDAYVLHLDEEQYPKTHIEWLKQHVGPAIENDTWSRINSKTRSILARVLDINNFPLFYRLIRDLSNTSPDLFNIWTSPGEGLTCNERAVQRMAFWSNYTDSMVTCKLLLEPNIHRAGKDKEPSAPITRLLVEGDIKVKTNWVIIEFENYIIADQLTSSFAAVRIFNKSLINEQKFLNDKEISTNDIVLSLQDDLHDHRHLWQSSLEERLRNKYSIYPNYDVDRFEGIGLRYMHGVGFNKPPQEQLNSRAGELEQWEKAIISFEMSLGKYETEDSLDSLIENRLNSMLTNNQEVVAISQLKGHCNLNKRWALKMLSNHLLTKPNGSIAEREEGERLHSKMIKRWGR